MIPTLQAAIEFTETLRHRVSDFDCGSESWESELVTWIKADPTEEQQGLWCAATFQTSIWLYETNLGDVVGYASLGSSTWRLLTAGEKKTKPKLIQIIPAIAVQKKFWGEPQGSPPEERYSAQIFADVISRAEERFRLGFGSDSLGLFVHKLNLRAQSFYKRFGFASMPETPGDYLRMLFNLRNV